jgi:hypothetical protein
MRALVMVTEWHRNNADLALRPLKAIPSFVLITFEEISLSQQYRTSLSSIRLIARDAVVGKLGDILRSIGKNHVRPGLFTKLIDGCQAKDDELELGAAGRYKRRSSSCPLAPAPNIALQSKRDGKDRYDDDKQRP